MKRKLIRNVFIFCLTVILVCGVFCVSASAESNYTITSYDIDMVVNENNTFEITENISVNFLESSHGIYRKIPLRNSVTRTDGTTSSNRAKVSNISVSEGFSTSKSNGYQVIKIGSSDATVIGKHSYTIKYTYDIGKDPLKNADELYFNLIGDEWDTVISGVAFHITMPKEFDKSSLGFSSGSTGTVGSTDIFYEVKGTNIDGYLTESLYPGSALTVRLTLPEGYFVGASGNVSVSAVVVMSICLFCVLIAAVLWLIYGRNREPVNDSLEYYPPKGLNPAEASFCYYGKVKTEGIVSLLFYLANKGYLEIIDLSSRGLFKSKKQFLIKKLKKFYDGSNECEKMFFYGLFNRGDAVSLDSLRNEFYVTVKQIKSVFKSEKVKGVLFEPSSTNKTPFLTAMAILIFAVIHVVPIYEYNGSLAFPALIFIAAGLGILFGAFRSFVIEKKLSFESLLLALFGIVFGGSMWVPFVLPCIRGDLWTAVAYAVGLLCMAAIAMFIKIMPRRTPFGNDMYGKIKGFRRFLESAEYSQMRVLAEQNSQYFDDIMPFAYALGISKKWMNQFKALAVQLPVWYSSDNLHFDPNDFDDVVSDIMRSAESSMTYSQSSSSGGGGSDGGGGSSGGGSGGGGGGSW